MLATKGGHADVVRVLMEAGADVHAQDTVRRPMFHFVRGRTNWYHRASVSICDIPVGQEHGADAGIPVGSH
jgi:hypothetical protein